MTVNLTLTPAEAYELWEAVAARSGELQDRCDDMTDEEADAVLAVHQSVAAKVWRAVRKEGKS